MSTFYPTSPLDPYEDEIRIPKDTDLPIEITANEQDDDCDPSNDTPFDFTGSTIVLEVFQHHSFDAALFTQANVDWTITQDADGVAAGVNNQLTTTLAWADLIAASLEKLNPYWFRILVTDSSGDTYVLWRGPFILDDK